MSDQIHNSVRTSSRKGSLVIDEDLRETVQRALLEIGKDDMEELMDVIYKLSSDVHITTALQLCRILTDHEGEFATEHEDLRQVIKGPLYASLRKEAGRTLTTLASRAEAVPFKPRTLPIHVCRVDVTQVSKIDQQALSFT
eukprot:6432453-Prymnesium_polylepis.1